MKENIVILIFFKKVKRFHFLGDLVGLEGMFWDRDFDWKSPFFLRLFNQLLAFFPLWPFLTVRFQIQSPRPILPFNIPFTYLGQPRETCAKRAGRVE